MKILIRRDYLRKWYGFMSLIWCCSLLQYWTKLALSQPILCANILDFYTEFIITVPLLYGHLTFLHLVFSLHLQIIIYILESFLLSPISWNTWKGVLIFVHYLKHEYPCLEIRVTWNNYHFHVTRSLTVSSHEPGQYRQHTMHSYVTVYFNLSN